MRVKKVDSRFGSRRGFALPVVMIASVVMMMVLVSGLTAASSVNAGLRSQYLTKLSRTAAESGFAMAKACIASNENTITWTNSEPLRPNTDCTGMELADCPSGSNNDACYVVNAATYKTSFEVKVVADSSGNPTGLSSEGILEQIRKSSGTLFSTSSSTAMASISDATFSTVMPGISASGATTCGVTYLYKAYCWGLNAWGEIGNGTTTNSAVPAAVSQGAIPAGVTIRQISASDSQHTCVLGSNAKAYCWGLNEYGEVGNGVSGNSYTTPVAVAQGAIPAGTTIKSVLASDQTSCALASNGKAYCWGQNTTGQLGNGTTTNSSTPVAVSQGAMPAGSTIRKIVGYASNSYCAYVSDGWVYCWGSNGWGQLGNGNTTNASTPVAVARGAIPAGVVVRNVFTGNGTTCVIASNAKTYCWGLNGGKLGNGSTADSTVPVALSQGAIPSGVSLKMIGITGMSACGIATNEKLYCWGDGTYGGLANGTTNTSTVPVAASQGAIPTDVTLVSIDAKCALGSDGKAYCWGYNFQGQVGDGTTTHALVPKLAFGGTSALTQGETLSVTNSATHTCAIGRDRKAACWGSNTSGQLGNGTTTSSSIPVAVSQGSIPTGVTVSSIDVGVFSTCVIAGNNKAYCWGSDSNGALGNGATSNTLTPGPIAQGAIPADAIIKNISMGEDTGCVVSAEEKAYCWGSGIYGQLGNGTSGATSQTPVAVSQGAIPAGVTLKNISAGGQVVCALGSNGWVYCWGSGGYGKLGNGTTTNSSTPVAISQGAIPAGVTLTSVDVGGYNSVCALGSNGKAYCWGYNAFGGLGNGTTTDSSVPVAVSQGAVPAGVTFKSIATGGGSACALGSNGKAYCWGNGASGQLGNGTAGQATTPVLVAQGAVPAGVIFNSISPGFDEDVCAVGSDKVPYCWGDNYYGQLGNGTTTDATSPTTISQRISWRGGLSMSGPTENVKMVLY